MSSLRDTKHIIIYLDKKGPSNDCLKLVRTQKIATFQVANREPYDCHSAEQTTVLKKYSSRFKVKQKCLQSPSIKANAPVATQLYSGSGVKVFNSHGFATIDVLPQHGFGEISKLHLCFFVEVK